MWARKDGDLVEIGLTDVAQNLAKGIISVTPKKVGRTLRAEQSVATVESGKWVGPGPAPGRRRDLAEINAAVVAQPGLINSDPYGAGLGRPDPPDRLGRRLPRAWSPAPTASPPTSSSSNAEGICCEE